MIDRYCFAAPVQEQEGTIRKNARGKKKGKKFADRKYASHFALLGVTGTGLFYMDIRIILYVGQGCAVAMT